ncbi:MAG: ATPase [Thermoprotei archaeon]|nr:MAG: ATPase [Thermoprotei archaeon]
MRIALFSGGKESYYASIIGGPIDAYVMFIYEFPEPSPHIINVGLSVVTGILTGKPVFVKRLTKGKEFDESVEFLKGLSVTSITAGDVDVEEHLKYMERLAKEVGAELKEPLWGMNSEEVLIKEVEYGIEALITGIVRNLSNYLGFIINKENYETILSVLKQNNCDAIGERGEYHTLVLNSPNHIKRLEYEVVGQLLTSRSAILKLTLR